MNPDVRANAFAGWIVRRRSPIIATALLFIAAGSLCSSRLDLDPSLESRFLKDNPQVAAYKELQSDFGAEPLLVVVWEGSGSLWEGRNLERVGELADRLRDVEGVRSIVSISSLFENVDRAVGAETLGQLPLARKLLVGHGGRTAVIAIVPDGGAIAPREGLRIVKAVKDAVDGFVAPDERAFVTGPLAMQSEAIELSRRDLALAVAIVALASIVLFGYFYRSARAVASAMAVSAAAIAGSCGIMAAAGVKLSQFSLIAIPILAAIALQDVVHLVEHFTAARRGGADAAQAVRRMYGSCAVPCIWTTLTTAMGFAALLVSDVEQIRSIGLVVVAGAPVALIASLMVVPALMSGERRSKAIESRKMATLVPFVSRRAPWIVLGMLLLVLVASWGLRYARVSLDFPAIFRSGVPFQRGLAEMDESHSGGASFEITMETTDGTDFSGQQKLRMMAGLQTALSLTAPVTTTLSPIDIGLTQYVLANGIPRDPAALVGRAGALVGEMRGAESSPLKDWISDDLRKVRIHARVRTDRNGHYDGLISALEYLRDGFATKGVKVSWSGFALLYKEMERRMVRELIASFAIAFAGVSLLMVLLFRSVKWGLLSMIPNVLPVLITVGIMGWAGVGFSLGLIILPAVGLGLVVDDTIHVVWGMRRLVRAGCGTGEAAEKVLATTGRALVLSTVILAAGFASLAFSPFISNNQLAVFMPLLLFLALAFDVIGIPSILLLGCHVRKVKDAPCSESPGRA